MDLGIKAIVKALSRKSLIEVLFNLVRLNLALMRDIAAPTTTIGSRFRKIDVFDDRGRMIGQFQFDSLNHSVVAPQTLNDFSESTRTSTGQFT